MFTNFKKYSWVLKPLRLYRTKEVLLAGFKKLILEPAWKKHLAIQRDKNAEFEAMSMEEMIKQNRKSPA
jgi:hypothetical protein